MQASKIIPNKVYAIKVDGELQQFRATAVITRRETAHGNPHDYKSTIEGIVINGPVPDGESRQTIKVAPDRVLGPFEDYQELVAKRDAEQKAKEQEAEAKKAAAIELWSLLYDKVGVPRPNDPKTYNQLFQVSFNSVDITREGVEILTKYLKGL